MKTLLWLFIFIIVLGIISAGIYLLWTTHSSGSEITKIILISIDTCRADYLSCYGYPLQTTPNIDALAQDGIIFENVIAPAPITLPSHSSMLTGTIPPYHGVHDNLDYQLGADNITLAEILKDKGYATGAVIGAFVLDSRFGLNQGFDYYYDYFDNPIDPNISHFSERRAADTSRLAWRWLGRHYKDKKFFLFLHYFDPHAEYVPPEPFASQFAQNLYAGEIAYTDHCIGLVIDKLKELGIYDSTLLIVTADHGESLGEHGEVTHTYFIYQSTVKVPMIIKAPHGPKGKRIREIVGIVDILPTVCALAGIEVPTPIQGQNLSPSFQTHIPQQDRYLFCESLIPKKYDANPLLSVVTSRFQFIQTTRCELYDLILDTAEKNNLIGSQPQRARVMREALEQIIAQSLRANQPDSKLDLDEQTRTRLESLGYVGGGIEENFQLDQSKSDPKDLLDFHLSKTKALQLMYREKYDEAENLCLKMLSQHSNFIDPYLHLSKIADIRGDSEKSVTCLRKAVEVDPRDNRVRDLLGKKLLEQEKYDEAAKQFAESLRIKPFQTLAHNYLAEILQDQGRLEEALQHCRESLRVEDQQSNTHCRVGNILCQLGNLPEALSHWAKSVEIQPNWPALNNLAWVKAVHENPRFRDPQQALELALLACSLTNYEEPDTLDTLAAAYADNQRFTEAIETAEKARRYYQEAGQQENLENLRKHLEAYQKGMPYRENL